VSQQKLKIVTTSWDDGDVRDLRIAEMLRSRDMRGTFYVPIEPFNGNRSLTHDDLRSLTAEGFEIGGHTIAHEIMSQVPAGKVDYIVTTCKAMLEDTLGERVRMFCYPRGRYTGQVVEALKKAGYDGARTVRLLATETKYGPYDLPTSTQVYPHTRTEYLRNIGRSRNLGRLYDYVTRLSFDDDWITIGKKLFDRVLDQGGIWHLWGHSWEIDQLGLWDQMPEMLDYVCGRQDVLYLNNRDLVQYVAQHAN
jgi:peptidoglycan/xylan/chitin deacetylase (PgdA/CDA1 family)